MREELKKNNYCDQPSEEQICLFKNKIYKINSNTVLKLGK